MKNINFKKNLARVISSLIPIKKYRRITRNYLFNYLKVDLSENLRCQKYIEKYIEIIDSGDSELKEAKNLPIWIYWEQGIENAPKIVQACLASVEKNCPDRRIIVLDINTITNYTKIPDEIYEKKNKGIISKTHFSDILRFYLLSEHGGTWMDATVFLSNPIPDDIQKNNFFAFSINSKSQNYDFHGFSSWFIHCSPKNPITLSVKKSITNYWENENHLINYYTIHLISYMVIKKYKNINLIRSHINNKKPHLLQNKLLERYDAIEFKKIIDNFPIHKLTYKINKEQKKKTFFEHIENNIYATDHVKPS